MSTSRYSRYLLNRELNSRKKNDFNSKYSKYGIFNQIRNRYRNSVGDVEDLKQTAKSVSDCTKEPENLSKSNECKKKPQRRSSENIATNNLPPNCDDVASCSTSNDPTIQDSSRHEDEAMKLPSVLEMFEGEVKSSKCETVTSRKKQTEAMQSSAVLKASDSKCKRAQKRKSSKMEMADAMGKKELEKKSKKYQILRLNETPLNLDETDVGESNISTDGFETMLVNTCELQLENQIETKEERDIAFLDQLNNISNQLENAYQNYSNTNSEVEKIIRENLYYNYINM